MWYQKFGSPRTSQKFDLFQLWTLIPFWLGRLIRPKNRKQTKKAQNWKSKMSAKLQRTFLLCKNIFPRCGNTDLETGPKAPALRCRANQTERKRQLAKLASEEAERTHLRRRQQAADRRETKQKLWKNFLLVQRKEHQRQHTRRTANPHPARDPPRRQNANHHPLKDPPNTRRPTPNFGMSSGTMPGNSGSMEMHFAMDTRMKLRHEWRQKRSKWPKLRLNRGLISQLFENNTIWHVYHCNRLKLSC